MDEMFITRRKTSFFDLSSVIKSVFYDYFLLKIVTKDTFSCLRQVEKWGFSSNACMLHFYVTSIATWCHVFFATPILHDFSKTTCNHTWHL
jgi:hypothetical protein